MLFKRRDLLEKKILLVILKFPFAWHVMVIAVIFTIISGLEYLIRFSSLVKDKVLNIPNLITLIRLLLIPFFIISIFEEKTNIAILIFAIIAVSDKIDGISARLMEQMTDFGSNFDSFTDWTFIFTTLISFIILDFISLFYGTMLAIALILIAIIKLAYQSKYDKTLTSSISKLNVGLGYITILTILLDFVYKIYFLIGILAMTYLTVVYFIIKSVPRKK